MSDSPNILLLYTDQQRFDALGCAGNTEILTPNLDRLAAEGTRFSHHFVQHPFCMPSRVSMLSGQYPSNLHITSMGVPVPTDLDLVSHMLKRAGYRTANIGKLHFLPHSNRDHREPHPSYGFDHLELSEEPGPYDDAYRAYIRRTRPDQLEAISRHDFPPASKWWRDAVKFDDSVAHELEAQTWQTVAFTGHDDATHTAFVGQRTIDYITRAERSAEPFFAIAGFFSPHSPLFAPQRFLDLYDPHALTLHAMADEVKARADEAGYDEATLRQAMHGYYAMVSEVDHWVGRILETLEKQGLADDTVVVFTSDHGEFLGDFLRWGKGYPGPDCISRVPLLLKVPGMANGTLCDALVEAVDIVPTLLSLAGVTPAATLDGHSLVPALSGDPFPGRRGVLMEDTEMAGGWRSWRTPTHRYILHRSGEERLFDLTAEFGEYRDVADDLSHRECLLEHRHALAIAMLNAYRPKPQRWCY